MSSVFSATVAPGNPILFPQPQTRARVLEHLSASPKLASVTQASRLTVRSAPEMVSSGICELDALTGGLPRGCLTQICGSVSSGRTSVLLAALASATRRQEVCALVDASDAFDPSSAANAGVDFEKLLWVRCGGKASPHASMSLGTGFDTNKNNPKSAPYPGTGQVGINFKTAERRENKTHGARRGNPAEPIPAAKGRKAIAEGPLEQALRATDLLLQSAGFGLILLDLGDIPFQLARRIPLTTWFRFQRAVETTPTIFFVLAENPLAQTCASLLVKLSAVSSQLSEKVSLVEGPGFSRAEKAFQKRWASAPEVPTHAQLLRGLRIEGELLRSRQQRKPVQSVTAFTTASFKLTAER
jgi:recombination protein RecA